MIWTFLIATLLTIAVALAQVGNPTGGFVEPTGTAFRAPFNATQIAAMIPAAARTQFTYPAPYNTTAWRITNASDCPGSTDCVNYHGYSYWPQINNHVGSDDMYMFLGLSQLGGGPGLTLYKLHKPTGVITKQGNLFPPGFALEQGNTGEMWHFSYSAPHDIYFPQNQFIKKYNIISQTITTVVDITGRSALLSDGSSVSLGCISVGNCPRRLWSWHNNTADTILGGILQTNTGASLGCLVFFVTSNTFRFYPTIPGAVFDECQIDRTGNWTMSQEDVGVPNDKVNRIFNNTTGVEFRRTSSVGNLAHVAMGYDFVLGQDGHGAEPSRTASYFFTQPMVTTTLHYSASFFVAMANHPTYSNAMTVSERPLANQYACASNADDSVRSEIFCFRVDGVPPLQQLIVAPVMTLMSASGRGPGCNLDPPYCKLPKGALDVTGRYFMWSSNMGTSRLDMFLVEVPAHLITDQTAPAAPGNLRLR
jgi:hypothetical protein